LLTQIGQGLGFDNPSRHVPYIDQYNFGFQRQITKDLMVELDYVGSRTHHLPVSKGINEISAADLAKGAAYLQQTVTNPFAGLLPGTGINGSTVQRQQLLRPFPAFTGITENALDIGKLWYNAFQMRVEKRFSSGLSFLSSYTLSKNMEERGFLNAQDTKMVRQLTDWDRTHRCVLSGIYDLPFGPGKRLAREAKGIVNHLINGWQVQRALAKMLPPQSPEDNDQFWLKITREVHVATAAAFGILAVGDQDDCSQRIRCGRIWQRMHLWATTQGLAMHPLNQMPERAAREQVLGVEPRFGNALRELMGDQQWQALMVFRIGYPIREALASPRRSIEAVVIA
jgi:hypothetical protein